jgi:hypothetical protein
MRSEGDHSSPITHHPSRITHHPSPITPYPSVITPSHPNVMILLSEPFRIPSRIISFTLYIILSKLVLAAM